MKQYDAIVVGCGMGGMAAAMLLAHRGKRVVVLEKNTLPGGRLSSYTKDGFTVDFGVHVISRGAKGPVGECLARVGLENAITYTNIRPIVRYKGQNFRFPHDLKDMVPPEDFAGLTRFMSDCMSMEEEAVSRLDGLTVEEVLNRYTRNEIIHSCICRIGSIYCALPSWEESAGEFIRCMVWEATARASGYPDGGCIAITNAFTGAIERFGGEVRLNTPVKKILVEDGAVKGVIAGGEEYRAGLVISNADIKHTMQTLVGPEHLPAEYLGRVESITYACAGPALKIALDRELTDIKMFSQFADLPQREYYAEIERGNIPDAMNLFFVCPSNFSEQTAPKGKQLWTVATPIPTTIPDEILKSLQSRLQEAMMNALDRIVPGYRDHILWTDMMSLDKMNAHALERGSTIGMAQKPGQVGESRLKQDTPVKGLYMVGAEAGGHGVGIELAANSALELLDDYLKY